MVVNDLGGGLKGEAGGGDGKRVADLVVDEIVAAGGAAVANYDSVENGASIVTTAIEAFGRVDVVVNNAGILRDASFKRMADADWDMIVRVHLNGAYSVTKAAWPHMSEQNYGKVLTVSSPAGLYGNVGQANYSMAKSGLNGLMQTLAKEGERSNIMANSIAPLAGTRMLATVMPEDLIEALKVEHIVSLVVYLCHEECEETGSIFECSGGTYQKVQLARAEGYVHDLTQGDPSAEDIRDNFEAIIDLDEAEVADGGSMDGVANVMEAVENGWDPKAKL